jgi:polysaccharide pyruvyl transferase WcaK-like protein
MAAMTQLFGHSGLRGSTQRPNCWDSRAPLLLGHFGGHNAGDEAILDGTCHLFASIGIERVRVVTRNPEYQPCTQADVSVETVPASVNAIVAAVRDASSVVMCGGTHFNDDFPALRRMRHYRYLARYLAVLVLARIWRRPVVAIGQGFGPLIHPSGRLLTRLLFFVVGAGTARDEASLASARRLGAGSGWQATFDSAAASAYINPSRSTTRDSIVIAPVYGTVAPEVWSTCAQVVDAMWDTLDLRRIDICTLRTGTRESDRAISARLAFTLRSTAPLRVTASGDDASSAVDVMGRARVVLCGRYHSLVLTLLAGSVPVVLPAHRKLVDTAELVGLPEALIVRHPNADAIANAIRCAVEFDPCKLRPVLDDLRESMAYDAALLAAAEGAA